MSDRLLTPCPEGAPRGPLHLDGLADPGGHRAQGVSRRKSISPVVVVSTVVLAVVALTAPLPSVLAAPADESVTVDRDGKIRCPQCDARGKEKCPDCGGKGVINKTCPDCDGQGERPCKVCTEGSRASRPGALVCSLCSGKGSSASGRRCSRCGGDGTTVCGSCLGDGVHACPKEVHDRVCPRCGFAGRITCRTCSGELWISPAKLASPAKSAPAATGSRRSEASSERRVESGSDAANEESASLDLRVLRSRFDALSEAYQSHFDVFAQDLRPEVAYAVDGARAQHTKLANVRSAAAEKLREELDSIVTRGRRFPVRFEKLYQLFRREKRSYLNAERKWREYAEVQGLPAGYRRDTLIEDLAPSLATGTRIAEMKVREMATAEPSGLLRDVDEIGMDWKGVERRARLELAAAKKRRDAEERAEQKAKEEAKKKRVLATKAERARSARDRTKRDEEKEREEARERDDPKSSSAAADRAGARGSAGWVATAPAAAERKRLPELKRTTQPPAPPPDSDSGGRGPFGVLLAAVVGFALACGVFFLKSSWSSRVREG